MQHQEFQPPEELRDAIKCFWYTKIDFGVQQSSFDVLPDGYDKLIFYFGSTCSISYEGGLQPLPSPFLMGYSISPFFSTPKTG